METWCLCPRSQGNNGGALAPAQGNNGNGTLMEVAQLVVRTLEAKKLRETAKLVDKKIFHESARWDCDGNWVNNIQRDLVGLSLCEWCRKYGLEYS